MKAAARCLSLLLVCVMLLCACHPGGDATTTQPTPVNEYDPNRPLPVLPEKFVSHDAAKGNLLLAKDGVAQAKIVVPAGNSKAYAAAADLSGYLTRITGAAFETITDSIPLDDGAYILVGPTAKTLALGEGVYDPYPNDEGYTIRREGNFLLLCGNDSGIFNGTQFAVTRFLEEAGCGWFTPDPLWQVVPDAATLSVGTVDKQFAPRFSYRWLSRVNQSLQNRWYCGGISTRNGHVLKKIVPPSSYSQNPEYFALVNGSRKPDTAVYWQYCYTNPDFAAAVAQAVIRWFDQTPTLMTCTIAANDGWNQYWCECKTCTAAGNHSDQMLVFANNVAAITSQKHPDKKVSLLAYHSTFLPPLNVENTHPNVEMMFCIETAPFVDLSKNELVHEGYLSINQVTYSQSWKENFLSYVDKAGIQNTAIWGWYCISENKPGWEDYPWVQGNTISNNLDLFEQLGIQEIFIDCESGLYELRWPLYYAAAKCMWDEGLNGEQVLYDACQKLFGAAADEMFLYYRHLADAAAQFGGTQDSVNWVPPTVFVVYGPACPQIQAAISAAGAKATQMTFAQSMRYQSQYAYWSKTYQDAKF